ncbi:MAG: hypothetical protein LBN08_01575 [Lactobacillales bacterium]|jgi:hypothetical protein|nr:hypothetical protein [Lactobacillales bacterium]
MKYLTKKNVLLGICLALVLLFEFVTMHIEGDWPVIFIDLLNFGAFAAILLWVHKKISPVTEKWFKYAAIGVILVSILSTWIFPTYTFKIPYAMGEREVLSKKLGGYTEGVKVDKDEKAIFTKAVRGTEYAEYTPVKVATQLVNGKNYKFYAKLGHKSFKLITVYVPFGEGATPKITKVEKADVEYK